MPVDVSLASTSVGGDELFTVIARDATVRKLHEDQLEHQATHDPLTGLANRKLFDELLVRAVFRAERSRRALAVLYMDLDGFKDVNDVFGHQAGDRVLSETARRLESVIRPGDIVARMGGDEFVVLCENLGSPDDAEKIATRIVQAVGKPVAGRRRRRDGDGERRHRDRIARRVGRLGRARAPTRRCTGPSRTGKRATGSRTRSSGEACGDQPRAARTTLPALMQLVHALTRLGEPLISARTRWMFGSHRRLFRLCENVTDLPNHGFFPQMSQTAAIAGQGYQRARAVNRRWPARFAIEVVARDLPGDRLDQGPVPRRRTASPGGLKSP